MSKFFHIRDRWYEVQPDGRGESAKTYKVIDKEKRVPIGEILRLRIKGTAWYANGDNHCDELKDAVEDLIIHGQRKAKEVQA